MVPRKVSMKEKEEELEENTARENRGNSAFSENEYKQRRHALGRHPLPPLQSFLCPITRDVMDDPVELSSGHTFERAAILKWLTDGHHVCPVTNMELENLSLKPNRLLRMSIEEWKERNTVIQIAALETKLTSEDDEEVLNALSETQELCQDKAAHKRWIAAEGLILVIVNLLKSANRNIRRKTFVTLHALIKDNTENYAKASDAGVILLAVRSLGRDVGEARQAVALLLELSKELDFRQKISEVQGCILLLVAIINRENPPAAADARDLLNVLSEDDHAVVTMAQVNYFEPLAHRLREGSDATRILMAKTLSGLSLTEQNGSFLVHQGGVLPPLVMMASTGVAEARHAAFGALQSLSRIVENRDAMIQAGTIVPLLEILVTMRTCAVSIRESAAETFANLALARGEENLILEEGTVCQLLSLLNLVGPQIQSHILRAFIGICHSPLSGEIVLALIRDAGAIQAVIPFCQAPTIEVRLNALKLVQCLTQGEKNEESGEIWADQISPETIKSLVILLSTTSSDEERVATMGVLSNLPMRDTNITSLLLEAGALDIIVAILTGSLQAPSRIARGDLVENSIVTLLRFTLLETSHIQSLVASKGVIPLLVRLLRVGTSKTKRAAAMCLGKLSESSLQLSVPRKNPRRWLCFSPPPSPGCRVHGGVCSVVSSFCLVEADAISALVQCLDERGRDGVADEAILATLATLLCEECWENGTEVIAEAHGVGPIIRLLSIGTPGVQEKALWILEKFFRKEVFKRTYSNAVQMPLIDLTQGGVASVKPLACRILAHLNILHEQSTYF